MATSKFSDLYPDVLPLLAADPSEPVMDRAIRRAAIEFCDLSRVWRVTPDAMTTVAGEGFYDLEPPAGAEVAHVVGVKVAGRLLPARTLMEVERTVANWRGTGEVQCFTQMDPEQIVMAPAPSESGLSLEIVAAMRPTLKASTLPGWIVSRYGHYIAAGAASKLMLMPDKPWTAGQAGVLMRDTFMTGVAEAKGDGESAMGTAIIRTTPQH